jgi:hypothetical protein
MNGRVYDASIGRFISADSNIFEPFDTQGFNRYSYVKNNPLKYTDPSGFETEGEYDGDREASSGNDNQAEDNHGSSDFGGTEGNDDSWYERALKEASITYYENMVSVFGLDTAKTAITNYNSLLDKTSIISSVLGKLWNSINTVIGLVYGGIGHMVGLAMGTNPDISFGNNAIQFTNNPFGGVGAITLGNTITYGLRITQLLFIMELKLWD